MLMSMTGETALPSEVATQLLYHVHLAAQLNATGEHERGAAESVLVWGLVTSLGVLGEARGPADDLPPVPPWPTGATGVVRSGHMLALQLQAHFTSEGRSELAVAYADAASAIQSLIDELEDSVDAS